MNQLHHLTMWSITLLTGLIAGLFFGYACSVNLGLGKLTDEEYIRAMQSINKEILNPVFLISFIAPVILLPLACWISYQSGYSLQFNYLLVATGIYIIAVFGVTMGANVPLNEALAAFSIHESQSVDFSEMRKTFEMPWNKFHMIRTIASITCFILVFLSLTKSK